MTSSKEQSIGPPPQDLAGYQHIVTGIIKEDDVMVIGPMRDKAWCVNWRGVEVEEFLSINHQVSPAIYRKMACPKAGDHDKGWQEVRKDNPLPDQTDKAKTYDDGKPPLANLPWAGISEVSMVQAYGHSKYKDFNNYRKGMEISRNLSCAVRHISDFMEGIDLDKESGRNHLAHACCRLLFVLQNLNDGTAIDDRYKKPN